MTAATIESQPVIPAQPERSQPEVAPASSIDERTERDFVQGRLAEDLRVERVILRKAIVGAIVGAVVCAPIYAGLVMLALRNSGSALLPPVAMAVGLGFYAGVFLGGCTGTLVGSKALEHHERENRPTAPTLSVRLTPDV